MLDLTPATFEDFERETARGNVVPVVRTVLADLQTPLGAFLRVAGNASHAFLLESIEGGERLARYSFIGANPWMIARGQGDQTIVEKDGQRETRDVNAINFLREYFGGKKLARRPGLAPLSGGAVGYLAYGAARWFERVLGADGNTAPEATDAAWMFFRTILAFDRIQQQIEITSIVFVDEAGGDRQKLRELYEKAVSETEETETILSELSQAPVPRESFGSTTVHFRSNWPHQDFET